jgi:hypothetical protein
MSFKNEFRFSLTKMRSITLSLLLFASATLCHAQLFSPAAPEPGVYVHATQTPASTAAAFVTQANAQGALGFAFAGNNSFGSSPFVSVYIRNVERPRTFTYEALTSATTATGFVTLLNTKGAQGFRYFGDSIFNGESQSLFVSDSSGSTYTYKLLAPTASASAFVTQANAQGALGYAYSGDVAFGSAVSGFEISSLFVKNNARNGTFNYETLATATTSQAMIAQANAQGARGFSYPGNYVFEGVATAIYMKDSSRPDKYVFETLARSDSTSAFVAQANGEGNRGFRYAADYVFGPPLAPTYFSIYVTARGIASDLSGDGKSDVLLRNTSTGQIDGVLMNGYTASGSATFMAPGSGWTATHTADLNGDGKADILWRHTDGRVAAWLIDGLGATAGSLFMMAGSGWTATHVADLNGDGKADILWRHTDGRVAAWLMDGLGSIGGNLFMAAGSGWAVTHAADLNADGKADILWRHTDGRVAAWLMDGVGSIGGNSFMAASSGWSITHTADLNADGKADILWRHTDGRVAAWLMDGLASSGSNTFMAAGSGWSITHMADLNGDGKADILWRNTDGSTATWIMNGLGSTGGASLIPAPNSWSVTYTGDLNGDGKTDLIWRHPDGRLAIWLMNGAAQTAGGLLAGPGVLEIVPQP